MAQGELNFFSDFFTLGNVFFLSNIDLQPKHVIVYKNIFLKMHISKYYYICVSLAIEKKP